MTLIAKAANVWACEWNLVVWRIKWKLLSSTFTLHCFIQLKATEQYFPVVLFSYYAVQGGFKFWVCR